jgi:hypothetical protein
MQDDLPTIREFLRRLGHPVVLIGQQPIRGHENAVIWPVDQDDPADEACALIRSYHRIFVNLNPLRRELLDARPVEPWRTVRRPMIDRISRLLIDLDAQGSSKAEAYRQMLAIREELGEPLMATDSGNGHALIYPVELPATSYLRVVQFLKELKQRYSCVDSSVGTPERLTRLIGTMNRSKQTGERIPTCLLT